MFQPIYRITPRMVSDLTKTQEAQTIVSLLPLPASILLELQKESKEQTILLSTRMEGNSLPESEARAAIYTSKESHEEQELFNLMRALQEIEKWEERQLPITEERIKELHAIIRVIPGGRRPKYSEYREEQNQVGRRNQAGFYLPPEPQDVPDLMEDLVAWVNAPEQMSLAAPIKAGIFMYQFLTIHPYMDGNGRTARMFATYILRRGGLGLKGLFVLERYYDKNLDAYYKNLQMDMHHNYYFGRNAADVTHWLEFFISGVATVFYDAAQIVTRKSQEYTSVEPVGLRKLNAEQRMVFGVLAFRRDSLSTSELRALLGISDRTLRERLKNWIESEFLVPKSEGAQRVRSVMLGTQYREIAESIQDEAEKYRYLLY